MERITKFLKFAIDFTSKVWSFIPVKTSKMFITDLNTTCIIIFMSRNILFSDSVWNATQKGLFVWFNLRIKELKIPQIGNIFKECVSMLIDLIQQFVTRKELYYDFLLFFTSILVLHLISFITLHLNVLRRRNKL